MKSFYKKILPIFLLFTLIFSCSKNSKDIITIPFDFINNQIIVDVEIEEKNGKYMFDTGCFTTHTNESLARCKFNKKMKYHILRETTNLDFYITNLIKVHGHEFKGNFNITNYSPALALYTKQRNLNGILGIDVFTGYWCKISIPDRKIYLSKKPFKFMGKRFSAEFNDGHLESWIDINGKSRQACIDTGYSETLGLVKRELLTMPKENAKLLKGFEHEMYLVKIDELVIGNYKRKNTYSFTNSPSPVKTVIGTNFIRGFDLTFDLTNFQKFGPTTVFWHKRFLQYPHYFIPRNIPEVGMFSYNIEDGTILIVTEDSFADLNGIKPGDKIIKINKNDFISMQYKKKNEYLFHPKDGTVFTILQSNTEKEIVFRKE